MQPARPPANPAPAWVQDVAVALAVGVAWFGVMAVTYHSGFWNPRWIVTFLWAGLWIVVTLALRRTAPGPVFWATVLLYPLGQRVGLQSYFHLLPLMIAGFGVTRAGVVRPIVAGAAAGASGLTLLVYGGLPQLDRGWVPARPAMFAGSPSDVLVLEALVLGAVVLGAMIRRLAETTESLRLRNAQLQALQEVQAHRAVLAERTRIARDLHDVVAHHMSAIVVRAQAADRVAANHPEAPAEAVAWIADEGKRGLTAMRAVVQVLRRDGEALPELAPAPALDDVRAAADRLTSAGRAVDLSVPDALVGTTPEVELAVVRIAQEALTNVLLHSLAPRASVEVADHGSHVSLVVRDPGPPLPDEPDAQPDAHGGNGIVNMRERAASCGGTLAAGPDESGGWIIYALLPKEAS